MVILVSIGGGGYWGTAALLLDIFIAAVENQRIDKACRGEIGVDRQVILTRLLRLA